MNELQIRVYSIDGATRTIAQNGPERANQTLHELNPTTLFGPDKITVMDDETEVAFAPGLVTRVDLISEQLSVWDYPFVLGALMELTEPEFNQFVQEPQQWQEAGLPGGTPMFLHLEMADDRHCFLWMKVAAGLPPANGSRLNSVFAERRLIFDLRTGGIGILNLAHLLRFSIYPELSTTAAASGEAVRPIERPKLRLAARGIH